MKRFVVTGFLVFIGVLPLFLGLACKVDGPANPSDGFPSALGTIVASNPSFTPTTTASPTLTPTVTLTPCTNFMGTPTPGISTFTNGASLYLNQYYPTSGTNLITTLKIWTAGAATVEAGIYSDSGNAPSSLLGETGIEDAVAGLNSYDLPLAVTLSDTSHYWLALHSSGAVDFTTGITIPTYISPIGASFAGLPVTVDGGTYQATPVISGPATLLSLNGTTCP